MTIIIPVWMLWAVGIGILISTAMSITHVVAQRELARVQALLAEERRILNINIANLMTNEVATQREKKAGWHKWTNVKYMEIKSPIIKRDADCRGLDTIMFANGVLIARERGAGADGNMDS